MASSMNYVRINVNSKINENFNKILLPLASVVLWPLGKPAIYGSVFSFPTIIMLTGLRILWGLIGRAGFHDGSV